MTLVQVIFPFKYCQITSRYYQNRPKFNQDIVGDKSARDLVQNVIRLVHGLGLKVVAEGLKTLNS